MIPLSPIHVTSVFLSYVISNSIQMSYSSLLELFSLGIMAPDSPGSPLSKCVPAPSSLLASSLLLYFCFDRCSSLSPNSFSLIHPICHLSDSQTISLVLLSPQQSQVWIAYSLLDIARWMSYRHTKLSRVHIICIISHSISPLTYILYLSVYGTTIYLVFQAKCQKLSSSFYQFLHEIPE